MPGGNEVELEFAQRVDNGMARVVAALVADDHVVLLRQIVYHASLAFIAPVNAYDCTVCHK